MTVKERLSLIIDADGRGAIRELDKVGRSAERDLGRAEKAADRWASKMTQTGTLLVGSSLAIGAALWNLSQSTSDLAEAADYSGRVFGGAAEGVEAFADSAASLGLSKRAAFEAMTTFGDLFRSLDKGATEVAGMSEEMTRLAADMASAKNTSPEDAIMALGAALRGESEPIRRYGVLLDEATLKQRALDMGLVETTSGTLPQAVKVQAAYGEILSQTAGMQGNFAATADGAANSQRKLAADMENAKAALGEGFLPVMTSVVSTMAGGIGMVSGFNEATGGAVGNLLAFGVVASGAVGGVSMLGGQVLKLKAAYDASAVSGTAAGAAMSAAFAPVAVVLGGMTAAYLGWSAMMKDAEDRAQALGDGIAAGAADASYDELRSKLAAINMEIEGIDLAVKKSDAPWDADYRAELSKGGAALMEQGALMRDTIYLVDALAASTGESEDALLTWVRQQEAAGVVFKDGAHAVRLYDVQVQALRPTVEGMTLRQAEQAAAYDEATDKLDGLIAKTAEYRGELDTALGRESEWQAALDDTAAALAGTGLAWDQAAGFIDLGSEAGRSQLDVLQRQRDAAYAFGEALLAEGASQQQAADAVSSHTRQIVEQLNALGLTEQQIGAVLFGLGLMPDQVTAALNTPGLSEAQRDVALLKNALDDLPPSVSVGVMVDTVVSSAAAKIGMLVTPKAQGGPVAPGRPYLVGEQGPELVTFGAAGHVTPAAETRRAMADADGGGGMAQVTVQLDGDTLLRAVAPLLRADRRSRVGVGGIG
jgi:hypothetical protein